MKEIIFRDQIIERMQTKLSNILEASRMIASRRPPSWKDGLEVKLLPPLLGKNIVWNEED